MSHEERDWNRNQGLGFGVVGPEDEFFHGWGAEGDSMTETWYWGFNVPQHDINCFVYCWVHPNLKVVTSGLLIYKGVKRHHLASELFDIRDYMSLGPIGNGSDIKLPNGLRVQVIEPLKHMRLSFADKGRKTSVEVDIRAISLPIVRSNNQHFEQVMKVTGELVLRGERYAVDCFNVRDRSWGELRPEDHAPIPPYAWVTGVFGEGFAFNLGAHDDPNRDPKWKGDFNLPAETAFRDGWIYKDGAVRRLVRGSKLTTRAADTLAPTRHVLEIEDTQHDVYRLSGEVVAGAPWSGWSNMVCHLGLVRWDMDGKTGWGETQEVQWNDFVWRYAGKA